MHKIIDPESLRVILIAIAGSILSLVFSRERNLMSVIAGVGAGVFTAYLFTQPTLSWFSLHDDYGDMVSGIYGLVGYNILKRIHTASSDATSLADLIKKTLGGK